MKFLGVFIFTVLLLGTESISLEAIGSEMRTTLALLNDFLVPLSTAKDNMIRTADDCLKLTNTSEQAYSLAVNITNFGVAAVNELGQSMNTLIGCSQKEFIKQLNCVFDQLEVVRTQVEDLQGQLQPYLKEGNSIYNQLVEQLHDCL